MLPGLPSDFPSNSNVESHPIIKESAGANSLTVCAFRIAKAITSSEGVSESSSEASSLTPLTKTLGEIPTLSKRRSRDGDAEINDYVDSGEPLNVAGGFTLDGLSAPFITNIEGDPSGIIGLSLPLLRKMVISLGYSWPDLKNK